MKPSAPRRPARAAPAPALADAARQLARLRALAASYGYPLFTLDRMALRVPEVAATLGFSESFVRNLIRDGELPAVRVRDALLVRTTDIMAFLDARPSSGRVAADAIAEELERSLEQERR